MARLSADEVSAAKRVPIDAVVQSVVQLDRRGFGLCPFHEERSPSFHVHLKRNRFKCFGCGAGGSTIDFVQLTRRVDFCSAVQILLGGAQGRPAMRSMAESQVRQFLTNETPRTQGNLLEYVQRLWSNADAPQVAEFYLKSRGIVRPKSLPLAIRGTRQCWCAETQQYRSALLAAVTVGNSVVALQRIWTESKYEASEAKGARAKLDAPKKTIGHMGHGAVQLSAPQGTLGIAEGVETALSCEIMFHMPVWAALGAQRMGSIALPEAVERVVVFGDNGDVGEAAAQDAVSAYSRRGYRAEAAYPELRFPDFNDQLCRR